jgi:hypothetical protein
MATFTTELIDLISSLTTEQQEAVAAFIRYLKDRAPNSLSTRDAVEEFMREHSQILELLAR